MNQGRRTQLGYLDFFTSKTENGLIDVPVFVDYNEEQRINPRGGDPHFNSGFETSLNDFSTQNQSKEWHRMFCNVEAAFFQYEMTLSTPYVLSKDIHGSEFELDALVIWSEKGGRLTK